MSSKHFIPMKFAGYSPEKGRQIFEAAGIKFVKPFLDRFYEVILPDGLQMSFINPRMKVITGKDGGQRAGIIVGTEPKEDGHIQLFHRFCVTFDILNKDGHDYVVGRVFNCNTIAFESEPIPFPKLASVRKKMVEKALGVALEWVSTYYPEWKDPAAYW
jgi:hypothetical protein